MQSGRDEDAKTDTIKFAPSLVLYPNPVSEKLFIQLLDAPKVNLSKVEIYDVFGQILLASIPNNHQTEIQTNILSSGVYFVKSTLSNGTVKTNRFVKQ